MSKEAANPAVVTRAEKEKFVASLKMEPPNAFMRVPSSELNMC
jgi:hypothetical protein